MKRIATLVGAVALTAIMGTPQQAESKSSFSVDATLEFCWNPYTLPCGFFAPLTLHKEPRQVWESYGEEYGPWVILPGPKLQLNFHPPYDQSIYRGEPVGDRCVEGQMIDQLNNGSGEFALCKD